MKKIRKKQSKIPESLQGILWSCNVKDLDLEKDKVYIIHQVLSYGELKQIRWLFKIYGKKIIREVFLKKPVNVYSSSNLSFIKNILLGLKNVPIKKKQYIQSLF